MEKFYLEEPNIKREKEILEFLNEFVEYDSEINGAGTLDKLLEGWTYEECLIELEKRKDKDYAYSINRCPSKTFLFIRKNDDRIVGMINIRYKITQDLLENGASHIGYSIRPTERRKGYNKIQLYLGLLESEKLGEKEVLLDCTVNNIGSNKSIIALGGRLEKTQIDESDNELTNYYWINVLKSIDEYSNEYSKYLLI